MEMVTKPRGREKLAEHEARLRRAWPRGKPSDDSAARFNVAVDLSERAARWDGRLTAGERLAGIVLRFGVGALTAVLAIRHLLAL